MEFISERIHNIPTTRKIIYGFVILIFIGALLLYSPIATNSGQPTTTFFEALFTSTSATCTVGLVLFDTYTHWSLFGQIVILILTQIGGFGFMTFAIYLTTFTNRKIGLYNRSMMQTSIAAPHIGGIVKTTKFIFKAMICLECAGALLLSIYFIPKFGIARGIYFAIFHSISSVSNAGFDLMGIVEPNSSLMTARNNILVNFVVIALGVIGGLGLFVWSDIVKCKFKRKNFTLHTKIVLTTTFILITSGTILFYIFESVNGKWIDNILPSFFQSAMAGTCGYTTVDVNQYTESSKLLLLILMTIGASPGSTAGGIKTTTLAVLVISVISIFKKRKNIECFRRRIDDDIVRRSACVATVFFALIIFSAMAISSIDGLPMLPVLLETSSAISSGGISIGITPQLSRASAVIIMFLMFFGRFGTITFLLAFSPFKSNSVYMLPAEKIQL